MCPFQREIKTREEGQGEEEAAAGASAVPDARERVVRQDSQWYICTQQLVPKRDAAAQNKRRPGGGGAEGWSINLGGPRARQGFSVRGAFRVVPRGAVVGVSLVRVRAVSPSKGRPAMPINNPLR